MNTPKRVMLTAFALGAASAVVFSIAPTTAQIGGSTPAPQPVTTVTVPGVVQVEGRGGNPLQAEVTGPGGGQVDVSGSANLTLSESSTVAFREPLECTVGPTSRFNVPNGVLTYMVTRYTDGGVYPFGRRTQNLVQNVDDKDGLSCGVGTLDAGTVPSCGVPGWGNTLLPNGGSATYEVSEVFEIWCTGCGGDATAEVTEALCVP